MSNKREDIINKLKNFNHSKSSTEKSKKDVLNEDEGNSDILYRGYLPHFDFEGLYQNITYRLNDSLPKKILEQIIKNNENESERRKAIEDSIDSGHGSCVLKYHHIANMIIENWRHFDQKKYDLIAFVIMPNHVHIIIKVYKDISLSDIVHSWKSYTSKKLKDILLNANDIGNNIEIASKIGWQEDYWDRYIRDETHYFKAIEYIHNNPVKAGLCKKPEDWKFSSFMVYKSERKK